MFAAKLPSLALVVIASLLATGCYCPMLSGRYGELGCCPRCPLQPPAPPESCDHECGSPRPLLRGSCLSGMLGLGGGRGWGQREGAVPSQQGPDYVSPHPNFHPCPTRPVFEPQLVYPSMQLVEPADSNPLRPTTRKLAPVLTQPAPSFAAAQP